MDDNGLLNAVIRYFVDQDHEDVPDALADHWARGDSRYLVGGGTDDQPAGRWYAANYAGRIWHILEQIGEASSDFPIDKRLKGADFVLWLKTIEPLRMKAEQEKASRNG